MNASKRGLSILRYIVWGVTFTMIIIVIFVVAITRYGWDWTGFDTFIGPASLAPNQPYTHSKTLWDWLQLLIVPTVLAIGGALFTRAERLRDEARKEEDRSREERRTEQREHEKFDNLREGEWQIYVDRMSELLEKGLKVSEPHSVLQDIARVRTLTTLRRIDPTRKGLLLKFLHEADLITKKEYANLNNLILVDEYIPRTVVPLNGADFSGAEVDHINLSGAVLTEVNLSGANLRNAHMTNVILWGANLYNAKLCHANLYQSLLYDAKLEHADLSGADIDYARLTDARLNAAILRNARLSHTNLLGADLRGADLTEAVLDFCNLTRVNIDGETNIDEKWLLIWRIVNGRSYSKDLRGSDLSNAVLTRLETGEKVFDGISLSECDLRGANLAGSILVRGRFVKSDLRGVNLRGTDLNDARFYRSDLRGADLSYSVLSGADFDGSDLRGSIIEEVKEMDEKWKVVWNIVNNDSSARDLHGANLFHANLRNSDLSNANLSGADLRHANLCGVNLSKANLNEVKLDGALINELTIINDEFAKHWTYRSWETGETTLEHFDSSENTKQDLPK